MEARKKQMATLLKQQERAYKSLQSEITLSESTISRLSKEAKNLQDLIDKLAKEESRRAQALEEARLAAAKTENVTPRSANISRAPVALTMPSAGNIRLPVAGFLIKDFGDVDAFGAVSEGVTIEARANSLIVAPMGGVVRFAGFFKNYGNMVIIEHEKGYHSLISGLESVTTKALRQIKSGEPVGKLPNASSRGGPPSLYYELRRNGKAIHPSSKIPALGTRGS